MLKTKPTRHWIALGLLVMLAAGCSPMAPSPAPPIERATPTDADAAPVASATAGAAQPTATPSPAPTVSACPERVDLVPPGREDQPLETMMAALQAYLDQGGDPTRVQLQEQEALHHGDLTGDGVSEMVFLLIDADSQQIPPTGHLVIYRCEAGGVSQLYHYEPGEWTGLELIGVADLTEDGIADLAFSEVSCGAHTCWHTPYVWSWQERDFAPRMGAEFPFPYPWYTLGDGTLVIASHGMGSVGAGPQRTITTTLAWTGTAITITDEMHAPPVYRYHAFLDGDRALAAEDFDTAEALYQRVVGDPSLEAWGAFSGTDEETVWLEALARWRLLTLYAQQANAVEADSIYVTLTEAVAPDTTTTPVVGLAQRFWRAYQRNGDVAGACDYAVDVAEATPVIDFLNTFGYANPLYEISHLCPFTAAGVGDLPF